MTKVVHWGTMGPEPEKGREKPVYAMNWTYDFKAEFPVHIFPFTVQGNRDKMHWHDYYEIGLCVKGPGKFVYVNKEYTVQEGDVFLTNNFENHVAITEADKLCEYIFLIFLPGFIANPQGGRQLDLRYLFPFDYNPLDFENRLPAGSLAARQLQKLIPDALEIYQRQGPFYEMELDIRLRRILLVFSKHFLGREKPGRSGYHFMNTHIQEAIQYMNLHFSENITLEAMARQIGISSSHFRHQFKAGTGVSFKQYITQLRMSQAKKLLLATEKPVSEIITDVGYSNMSQFYRVFKKNMFMSPAEYRNRHRVLSPY